MPLRVRLFVTSPRYTAGFPLLSFTQESNYYCSYITIQVRSTIQFMQKHCMHQHARRFSGANACIGGRPRPHSLHPAPHTTRHPAPYMAHHDAPHIRPGFGLGVHLRPIVWAAVSVCNFVILEKSKNYHVDNQEKTVEKGGNCQNRMAKTCISQ